MQCVPKDAAVEIRVSLQCIAEASAGKGMSGRRRGWLVLTTALLDLRTLLAQDVVALEGPPTGPRVHP